ncbi:DUF2273 domain-containing protein [Paenibacillus aurantius]|uniref:DUF2273 domain-containing protein n=1 Tax=Paenibacillus aurantius TaxID=2918900 RepID=A0AA96L9X4_9BACL|nr:DUF2273 domain-containing protein [Paenibacillus aurantius]WJH34290.1 DUF2273 domain-containing protein [Paenibacillus sp. CC-CFT747]WNQ09393.1 DUF2273 domain-containing protein [Paenibacillus aurantius]
MWRELWEKHTGKCIGAACGVFLGFVYLIWGFWDMLIFAFITYIGYYVGKKLDSREPLFGADELWQRLMERWRMFR